MRKPLRVPVYIIVEERTVASLTKDEWRVLDVVDWIV
jgi:hypothetical protein